MIIKTIPLSKINPAPYNPRKDLKPGDPEYEKIKRSIEEFELVEPLVWNKRSGNLIGGHQRYKVLKEKKVKTVEVSVVDIPPSREKALNIALNKIQGEWDYPKLKDLITEIDTGEFDIEITGFDEIELKEIFDYEIKGIKFDSDKNIDNSNSRIIIYCPDTMLDDIKREIKELSDKYNGLVIQYKDGI